MDDTELARRPGRFDGGLMLRGQKAAARAGDILEAPVPDRLVLPLTQHLGEPATPCVAVGDRVLRGQPLTRTDSLVSAELHAPTSGRVVAIEDCPVPRVPSVSARCLVIEADGKDEPFPERETLADYLEHPPHKILEQVRKAGIVGLGGAVFPAHVKLNRPPSFACEVLVLNGVECEPYISCDQGLMQEHAAAILEGASIMMYALGVTRCLVAIESDKIDALEAMEQAVKETNDDRFETVAVEPIYPAGSERQLIKALLGREVPAGGLPLDVGCVCHNVGTAFAVKEALIDGLPLIRRVVSVTGPGLKQPHNLWARLGTPVRALVEACGGYTDQVSRLVMGGSMMGVALESDDIPVVKACNCILALTAADLRDGTTEMPCIRCGNCSAVCPARLLPQQLHWYARAGNLEQVMAHDVFDCIECGCCDLVCPSHIPLTQRFRKAKIDIWDRKRAGELTDRASERIRENRRSRQDARVEPGDAGNGPDR